MIDPTTHVITEFSTVTPSAGPDGIAKGPDGNLWFAENNGSRIGMISPTTHVVSEFIAAGGPVMITAGPDKNLWFTLHGDAIGQITLGAGFNTLTPCRVFDTRLASGPTAGAPLTCGTARSFTIVGGTCGVPASAQAVSVNLTATASSAQGNLRLFPAGAPSPLVSTLNYTAGLSRANNAVAALGTGGQISVLCSPSGTTHVILDVNGYFE
jgi:hypothetical protein